MNTDAPQQAELRVSEEMQLVALKTLKGDVRDYLLDRQKHDHNALPWNVRGEDAQSAAISQTDAAAELLVRRVVSLVMTQNRRAVVGKLKKAALGDSIKLEIHTPASIELRHELLDQVGLDILLVIGGPDEFLGDRGMPKPDPDQASLFNEQHGGGPDDRDDDPPVFDSTPSGGKK